jgi:hypothetical protein
MPSGSQSSGHNGANNLYRHLRPEMCSLNMVSMNFRIYPLTDRSVGKTDRRRDQLPVWQPLGLILWCAMSSVRVES